MAHIFGSVRSICILPVSAQIRFKFEHLLTSRRLNMCSKETNERKSQCGCVRPACSSSRACQGSEAGSWRQLCCSARYNATRPGSFASPRAGWETAAGGLEARKRTPWKGLCRGSRTGCKRWERPEAGWRSWRWGWWGLEWLDQSPGKTPWDPWRRCIPDSALWEKCGHHGLPSGSSAKRAAVGISRRAAAGPCAEIRVEISFCRSKILIPPLLLSSCSQWLKAAHFKSLSCHFNFASCTLRDGFGQMMLRRWKGGVGFLACPTSCLFARSTSMIVGFH